MSDNDKMAHCHHIFAHDIKPGTKIVTETGTVLEVLDKGTKSGILRLVRSQVGIRAKAECYIADWARTEDGTPILLTPEQRRAIAQGG